MDHSEEEGMDDMQVSMISAETSKSGRVRKKSTKLLEMEEAEELEKQQFRRIEKPKAVTSKKSRPRPPEGIAMAVTNAPVLDPIPGQGHSPQMRMLLTTDISPPPAKKQKVVSPKGQGPPTLSINPGIAAGTSLDADSEALKLKLQLGAPTLECAVPPKSPKKAKGKKEIMPSLPGVQSNQLPITVNTGDTEDPGLKLKLVLSPKDKASIHGEGAAPKSSKKKQTKKATEKCGDPESIFQVQLNTETDTMLDDKSDKSKKKKKKKETEKKVECDLKDKPKVGSPGKHDLQTASLHLLAALSQATQSIPKTPTKLATASSPPLHATPPKLSIEQPRILPVLKSEVEDEAPLIIDTAEPPPPSSKSPKKKKTKKDKAKELSQEEDTDTNYMAMKLQTFAEKKAKKGKKDQEGDKPKKKRKRGYTAYMMWCNSYRGRVVEQNPGIDFATISRRLGEIWQALPEKEKMSWKRKAKKLNAKGSTIISTGKGKTNTQVTTSILMNKAGGGGGGSGRVAAVPQGARPTASVAATKTQSPHDEIVLGMPGVSPGDVAAHLKLLGESLSIIGARLQEHQGLIAVQGSLSVLLDSMLCALAPLTCLTTQVPQVDGCPGATHSKTLDNIAYIMPGIG